MAVIVIVRPHAQSALTTHQQARQQRPAGPHRADVRSVGAKLRLIALELLTGDVGGHPIRQEHLGFLGMRRTSPGARTSWLLPPPIGSPHAIGINAGIDRIAEQVVQRGPVDAAPFSSPLPGPPGVRTGIRMSCSTR